MPDNEYKISINPERAIRILFITIGIFVFISSAGYMLLVLTGQKIIFKLLPLFDIDMESNVPNYFSSIMLLSSAMLFGAVASASNGRPFRGHWRSMAFIFLYLSVDEAISIHERLIRPMREMFHTKGVLYFPWVTIAIPLTLIFLVVFWRFLLHIPKGSRYLFITAAVVYLTGGLGFEMLGGWYLSTHGKISLSYVLMATVEETLEMCGSAILIFALLDYIRCNFGGILFSVEKKTGN